jgi:hypothetical protein
MRTPMPWGRNNRARALTVQVATAPGVLEMTDMGRPRPRQSRAS